MSRRPARGGRAALRWVPLLLALACQSGGGGGGPGGPGIGARERDAPSAAQQRLWVRQSLQQARTFRQQGRADAAERAARRGLQAEPDDPTLLRELGHALEAQGRDDEARAVRARADAIDPPPAPLPRQPFPVAEGDTLVVLVPGGEDLRPDDPGRWPSEAQERALADRIALRLPGASLLRADPGSVAEARRILAGRGPGTARALSLRVDRADCRFSTKDGAIAVAMLRVAAAGRGEAAPAPLHVKAVVEDPPEPDCEAPALARALEQALESEAWQRAASRGSEAAGPTLADGAGWETSARALFPGIGRRIARGLGRGEALLRAGQLAEALRVFEAASALDPEDAEALAWVDDTRRSLVLAREIAEDAGDQDALDPRLSPAQRAAAEVALDREQHRREELLSALAVLDEDLRAPPPEALSGLRPTPAAGDGFGAQLARRRAGGAVEARSAYAPDGSVLARYFFAPGEQSPLVREEDTDGDGAADRWIAYRDGARGEIFEDGRGRGRPDLHLIFAAEGARLERVELDVSGDARPDRILRYEEGRLRAEASDTDGDGRLDRFDRFGSDGRVDVREEDLDGDGAIDVRSEYRSGKLVRREIASPELAPES